MLQAGFELKTQDTSFFDGCTIATEVKTGKKRARLLATTRCTKDRPEWNRHTLWKVLGKTFSPPFKQFGIAREFGSGQSEWFRQTFSYPNAPAGSVVMIESSRNILWLVRKCLCLYAYGLPTQVKIDRSEEITPAFWQQTQGAKRLGKEDFSPGI